MGDQRGLAGIDRRRPFLLAAAFCGPALALRRVWPLPVLLVTVLVAVAHTLAARYTPGGGAD